MEGRLEDPILNTIPFVVLLLPLVGFIVLALFGDWIRDEEKAARAKNEPGLFGWTRRNGTQLAGVIACTGQAGIQAATAQ